MAWKRLIEEIAIIHHLLANRRQGLQRKCTRPAQKILQTMKLKEEEEGVISSAAEQLQIQRETRNFWREKTQYLDSAITSDATSKSASFP